jgi:hypothetical protein
MLVNASCRDLGVALVIVVFTLAHVAAMPHRWSPTKLAARRAIAIQKSYVVPKPAGFSHVLTPSGIAKRVKGMSLGLEATMDLELATGLHRRTGIALAAAARPLVGNQAADAFLAVNQKANACKHKKFRWADSGHDNDDDPRMLGDLELPPLLFNDTAPRSNPELHLLRGMEPKDYKEVGAQCHHDPQHDLELYFQEPGGNAADLELAQPKTDYRTLLNDSVSASVASTDEPSQPSLAGLTELFTLFLTKQVGFFDSLASSQRVEALGTHLQEVHADLQALRPLCLQVHHLESIMETVQEVDSQSRLCFKESVARSAQHLSQCISAVSVRVDTVEKSLDLLIGKLGTFSRFSEESFDTAGIKEHLLLTNSRFDVLHSEIIGKEARLASLEGFVPAALEPQLRGCGPGPLGSQVPQDDMFSEPQVPEVGSRVMLHSLNTEALNGLVGTIIKFDIVTKRVGVKLDQADRILAIRIDNLFLVGCAPPPPSAPRVVKRALAHAHLRQVSS